MKSKQELKEEFHWWISCIPDKIERLQEFLPEEVFNKLDYSIFTLDILEKYLLENYTLDDIRRNLEFWDSCASYIGVVYEQNIPSAHWYVELEDTNSIIYGLPILRVKDKLNFEPHSYITTLIDRKRGNLLSSTIEKHKKYLS